MPVVELALGRTDQRTSIGFGCDALFGVQEDENFWFKLYPQQHQHPAKYQNGTLVAFVSLLEKSTLNSQKKRMLSSLKISHEKGVEVPPISRKYTLSQINFYAYGSHTPPKNKFLFGRLDCDFPTLKSSLPDIFPRGHEQCFRHSIHLIRFYIFTLIK